MRIKATFLQVTRAQLKPSVFLALSIDSRYQSSLVVTLDSKVKNDLGVISGQCPVGGCTVSSHKVGVYEMNKNYDGITALRQQYYFYAIGLYIFDLKTCNWRSYTVIIR